MYMSLSIVQDVKQLTKERSRVVHECRAIYHIWWSNSRVRSCGLVSVLQIEELQCEYDLIM